MGSSNSSSSSQPSETIREEYVKLKQELNWMRKRYHEERDRGDQLIQDARFVAVSSGTEDIPRRRSLSSELTTQTLTHIHTHTQNQQRYYFSEAQRHSRSLSNDSSP